MSHHHPITSCTLLIVKSSIARDCPVKDFNLYFLTLCDFFMKINDGDSLFPVMVNTLRPVTVLQF